MTTEQRISDLEDRNQRLREAMVSLSLEYFAVAADLERAKNSIRALEATRDELRHCLLHEAIHLTPLSGRVQ